MTRAPWLAVLAACGRVGFDSNAATIRDAPAGDACAAAAALAPGLVGWWKLDEGAGTLVADSAGGNVGVLIGGTRWTTGHAGGAAVSFDGATGHIDVAGTFVYATQNAAFSFSAWFDLQDYSTTTPDLMQMKSDSTSPFHVLMSSMTGYLGLSTGSGDGAFVPTKTLMQPSTGTWHHVVMAYNGLGATTIGNFALYLDAQPQSLVAADGYATQAEQSRIGAAENALNNWIGAIEDVRVYARELAASDVAALFALPCR